MIAPADLEQWMQALLEASGLEPAAAETVAVSLVHANRRGTDSHGVARLPVYSSALRGGTMNRNDTQKIERRLEITHSVLPCPNILPCSS